MQDFRHPNAFAEWLAASLGKNGMRLLSLGLDDGDIERGWRSFGDGMATWVVARSEDQGEAALRMAPGVGAVAVAVADFPDPVLWDNPPFGRFNDSRARYLTAQAQTGERVEPLADWVRRNAFAKTAPRPVDLDYQATYALGRTALLERIDQAGFGEADFLRMDGAGTITAC